MTYKKRIYLKREKIDFIMPFVRLSLEHHVHGDSNSFREETIKALLWYRQQKMSGFKIYSPVMKSPYLFQICFSAHSMVFVALSCCSNAVDSKQALIQESKSPSIPHSCSFTHGWLAAAFVNNYKVPGRKRSCVGGISVWPWPCIRPSSLPSRPFINRSLRALQLSMCNKCLWDGFWIMTKKAHCTTALDKGKNEKTWICMMFTVRFVSMSLAEN